MLTHPLLFPHQQGHSILATFCLSTWCSLLLVRASVLLSLGCHPYHISLTGGSYVVQDWIPCFAQLNTVLWCISLWLVVQIATDTKVILSQWFAVMWRIWCSGSFSYVWSSEHVPLQLVAVTVWTKCSSDLSSTECIVCPVYCRS